MNKQQKEYEYVHTSLESKVVGHEREGIAGARKDDTGKSPIYRGVLSYFPKAIRGVALVSAFGASKYAWNGWIHVPDGHGRYSDGLLRHLGLEAEGEVLDSESGLHHDLHSAWNALARVELRIRSDESHLLT